MKFPTNKDLKAGEIGDALCEMLNESDFHEYFAGYIESVIEDYKDRDPLESIRICESNIRYWVSRNYNDRGIDRVNKFLSRFSFKIYIRDEKISKILED